MRGCFSLYIFLVSSLFPYGYGETVSCPLLDTPPGCEAIPGCTGLMCNINYPRYGRVTLRVHKCSDPVLVELLLGSSTISYNVGGPRMITHQSSIADFNSLVAHFSRNTTHLNFTAMGIYEGDIAVVLVPDVEFPLEPHTCMCQSMDILASNIRFSVTPNVQLSCATSQNCSEISCNISTQNFVLPAISFAVDPCLESITLSQTQRVVFNETESRAFSENGISVVVDVTLVNHNYSLDIQMIFSGLGRNYTIIPLSTISLDRSSCTGELVYYPGAPSSVTGTPSAVTGASSSVTGTSSSVTGTSSSVTGTSSSVTGTPSAVTGTSSSVTGAPSSVAVAVAVPVSLLLVLLVAIVIVVAIVISVKRHRRGRMEYNFQRMAFSEDQNDEEDV